MSTRGDVESPLVLVAGGGVAALEACLALRSFLPADDLRIALLSPASRFDYRPLAVLEPFEAGSIWEMDLARFAADQDLGLRHDALDAVEPGARRVLTRDGEEIRYDRLVVAVGARPEDLLPGAVTFRGGRDAAAVRAAVDRVGEANGTLAFVVPEGAFWTLPLYELAILAADRLASLGSAAGAVLVTPEDEPLQAFGPRAAIALRRLLEERGVRFMAGTVAVAAHPGHLELARGRLLAADAVVALPRLCGPGIPGLPQDPEGFLPVDEHGRVRGCEGVFAAGDVTDFPLKQGGLATQQADTVAEAILADVGFPIVPRPFRPILQGVLYTGRAPAYLRAPAHGVAPSPRPYSLWWPPSKIAGRHLSPYLTTRGAPRAPEVRPDADVVTVEVDLSAHAGDGSNVARPSWT